MPLRSTVRSFALGLLRPAYAALDRRFETLAARLELHTGNLNDAQREELRRVAHRLDLDVAVVSEHLLGIERVARRVMPVGDGRLVVACPGDLLRVPAGEQVDDIAAYASAPDGTWHRVAASSVDTLRIARLVERPGV